MASDNGSTPSPHWSPPRGRVLLRALRSDPTQEYLAYVPHSAAPNAPVLVSVHGISRNAYEQAVVFSQLCETYGAVLVVPVFHAEQHRDYQRLGRKGRGPRVDHLLHRHLAEAASLTGADVTQVFLFGFSAGAQFAHRYLMAHPHRVARAVVAAAGWYTFPDSKQRFPYGIRPNGSLEGVVFDAERFLRVPVEVLVGSRDLGSTNLKHGKRVDAQGSNRVERARRWVAAMHAAAEAHGLEPAVTLTEVPGIDHSFTEFMKSGALVEHVGSFLFRSRSALPAPHAACEPAVTETVLMPGADKLRRRGRVRPGGETWAERKPEAPEPDVLPATVEEDDDKADAVARLLGEAVPSPLRDRLLRLWGRMRWALLAIAAVGLAAQIVLWVNYRAMHVTSRNAAVRGHLAEIGSRITGLVTKVEVDVGDRVTAGQVLVRLEDRHLVAEVEEARAEVRGLARAVEVERLAIENQRSQTRQEEREAQARVAVADAQTKAAKVRADDARRDQELRESLFSRDGVVSAENVRDAASRRRTAEALLEEAQANAIVAESAQRKGLLASDALTIRDKKVEVLETDLLRAQARLSRAEADLEGASIRAPEDGAIVRRIIQPGGSVEIGQPIIAMWLGGDVWVEAWIDEDDIGSVSLRSEATVTFHSFPGREFAGVVDNIGLATDFEMPETAVPQPRSSRMRGSPVLGVRIRLTEPPPDLMPGLSAVVAIRKKE